MYQCRLTTFDNPFDPFEQFTSWLLYDKEKGYNTSEYLARIVNVSSDMSEKEENEEIERQMRNDEMCLCDDIYTDEEIKEFALSGLSRVRDEVLERLFTPEEIVEIKKRRKERVDAENARRDAVDEEERKQLELEATLKLELRKKDEKERRREWYRKRRRSRRNKHK